MQTGLGRTGWLWGVEAWGVQPDILVTGKGLSGGLYPVAAAVLRKDVGGWLTDNAWGHVSTFGGAEPGCVVGSRVLDLCRDPARSPMSPRFPITCTRDSSTSARGTGS